MFVNRLYFLVKQCKTIPQKTLATYFRMITEIDLHREKVFQYSPLELHCPSAATCQGIKADGHWPFLWRGNNLKNKRKRARYLCISASLKCRTKNRFKQKRTGLHQSSIIYNDTNFTKSSSHQCPILSSQETAFHRL